MHVRIGNGELSVRFVRFIADGESVGKIFHAVYGRKNEKVSEVFLKPAFKPAFGASLKVHALQYKRYINSGKHAVKRGRVADKQSVKHRKEQNKGKNSINKGLNFVFHTPNS